MEQRHEVSSQESKEGLTPKSGEQRRDTETKKDEYKWRLAQFLGPDQADNQEYQSDSNSAESVCTEDFAVKFKQGMVEPIACGGDKEDEQGRHCEDDSENVSLSLALCEGTGDHFALNTARREDILQQFKEELEDDLQAALKFSAEETVALEHRKRRDSIESLGGQISRMSQVYTSEPSSIHSLEIKGSIVSHLSSNREFQVVREDQVMDKYPEQQDHVPNVSSHDTPSFFPKVTMSSETHVGKMEYIKPDISKDLNHMQDMSSQIDTLDGVYTLRSEDNKKSYTEVVTKNEGHLQPDGSCALPNYRRDIDGSAGNLISGEKTFFSEREVLQSKEESKQLYSQLNTSGTFSLSKS